MWHYEEGRHGSRLVLELVPLWAGWHTGAGEALPEHGSAALKATLRCGTEMVWTRSLPPPPKSELEQGAPQEWGRLGGARPPDGGTLAPADVPTQSRASGAEEAWR